MPTTDLNGIGAGTDATAAFIENTPLLVAPTAVVTDPESDDLVSMTVTLIVRPDGFAESLELDALAREAAAFLGLTTTYNRSTGVLAISGAATAAEYEAILRGVEYRNASHAPTTTNRTVSVVVSDAGGPSAATTATISVAAVNDAPVIVLKPVDEAVVSTILGGVSIFDNDGVGALSLASNVGSGASSFALSYRSEVADFNGDGFLDIVTVNSPFGPTQAELAVRLGNGAGDFGAALILSPTFGNVGVATGDVNGDGNIDLVVGSAGETLAVLFGDGAGGIAAAVNYFVGFVATFPALGDFDGDGDLDIAAGNEDSDRVGVSFNNGLGIFGPPTFYEVGFGPYLTQVADLNGDGFLDIVTANSGSADVSVLLGNGDGTFQPEEFFPVGFGAAAFDIGDINGDGLLDLVAVCNLSNSIILLMGDAADIFVPGTPIPVSDDASFGVALEDVDLDGRLDIALTVLTTESLLVFRGNGDGTFAAPASIDALGGPAGILFADIDVLNSAPADAIAFTEGGTATVFPELALYDLDGTTLASATVTIGGGFAGYGDLLMVTADLTATGITAGFAGGVLTLSGVGSVADYQAALRSVVFTSGDNPDNFGANASRMVSVVVDDGLAGGTSASASVDLIVAAINDAPTAVMFSASVAAENSAAGTVIGALSAVDPDSVGLTFSIQDDPDGKFAIAGGNLVVSGALDFESSTSHSVTVRATDSGGLVRDQTFTISVANVNEAPASIALSAVPALELIASGALVGTVSGTDPDAGDALSYTLVNDAGGRFALVGGQLRVANGLLLDVEQNDTHGVTIRATDAGGLTLDRTFIIDIANVDPEFIIGTPGEDRFFGGPLVDTFDLLGGRDTAYGGGGADIVDGGPADDVLLGGPGNDTYHVDNSLDLVDEGAVFPGLAGLAADFDTIISTADWFWDVYSVAERLIISEEAVDTDTPGTTIIGSIFSNEMVGNSGTNVLFGRGGSDIYRPGAGLDFMSFSTLGVTDENGYVGVDGVNTLVVEEGNFYDIVYEFESGKDKVDLTDFRYATAAEVYATGVDDGLGNSYFVLGDGLDYVYFIGLEVAEVQAADFIV